MQNPDIACETQTTHTKPRQRIRNPESTYETQKMHTKPRQRMRNADNAYETQTTHTKLGQQTSRLVSLEKHEIKTGDLCLIALSGFRLRCLRFACVVSVSYALSEFRLDNVYETPTTHTKLRQRMRNVDNANETQTTHTKLRQRMLYLVHFLDILSFGTLLAVQ
jgi:hypothetical protein